MFADEIEQYLGLSQRDDPEDHLLASQNLCPCHVRWRIDAMWQALYRMMEDPDMRVRRAAWHTLKDGCCPTDPAMYEIFDLARENDTNKQVRGFVETLAAA